MLTYILKGVILVLQGSHKARKKRLQRLPNRTTAPNKIKIMKGKPSITQRAKGCKIMSKIKTTRKEINNMFSNVFYCGYCDLQHIISKSEAVYYNCGVYGWNFDVFIDYPTDTAITTGYRNMTGRRIPSEIIEKYSNAAKEIHKLGFGSEVSELLEQNKRAFFDELATL